MNALKKNETWDIVDLPKGKRPVRCKWVFSVKCKVNGYVEKYKVWCVAKRCTHTFGIDD